MSVKKSNDTIWNRNSDLPICSAVQNGEVGNLNVVKPTESVVKCSEE
jgi:hypothetical protein